MHINPVVYHGSMACQLHQRGCRRNIDPAANINAYLTLPAQSSLCYYIFFSLQTLSESYSPSET